MRHALLSIQHSGTHFVRDLFPTYNWERMEHMNAMPVGLNAVVPLRHPARICESWRRRIADPALERSKQGSCLRNEWMHLINNVDQHNPLYMPIDVPDRQAYLDRINYALHTDAKTDWTPVNSFVATHSLLIEDIELSEEDRQLLEEIKPFTDRFYS